MRRVVLTDHPWADVDVERRIIEGAGYDLVVGPVEAVDPAAIAALVAGADPDAIITCWAQVDAIAIAAPTRLAIVARMGVGLDNIDVAAATARGAWVTNVPDYCVAEVSDHAIALTLCAVRGVVPLDRAIKAQGWHVSDYIPRRLSELTVGVIGYGRIGRATARKLVALGCQVIAYDPGSPGMTDGVEAVAIDEIQTRADVIILHMPLIDATAHVIDRSFLAGCNRRPLIVNVSRGGLIDNVALIEALETGLLRGAALDVVDGEPAPPRALLDRRDVIATPHVGYLSDASLIELRQRACEEVVRVLSGQPPQRPCNRPVVVQAETLLPGGISSDIRILQQPSGPEVVKTALGKLKVAADWFSDPARSLVEARALLTARELLGQGCVPDLLWSRPDENRFAMSLVDPRYRNWKQQLLAGHVDQETARAAGRLLGRLHSSSATRPDIAIAFCDQTFFQELRVEPFFERVAAKMPDLSAEILSTVNAMSDRRVALVHGDFSPKNILADGPEVVVLDFEVAHWGDPRFDLGFCLSHLMLKACRPSDDRAGLLHAGLILLDGYAETGLPGIEDVDLARITACMMLARTDGASPVDYLDDGGTAVARHIAIEMLNHPDAGLRHYLVDFGTLETSR